MVVSDNLKPNSRVERVSQSLLFNNNKIEKNRGYMDAISGNTSREPDSDIPTIKYLSLTGNEKLDFGTYSEINYIYFNGTGINSSLLGR